MEGNEFGKFASGKQLLHAYLELEKDYTKKCQKLAELLRKLESAETVGFVQNAEFDAENGEHSVKNAQNDENKTEYIKKEIGGIITDEDACCDSTIDCLAPDDDATDVEKNNAEHDEGANAADEKKPIYLSPMFGYEAKEFFGSSAIAAVFEKDILDLVATDYELSCMPNALETAAERIVGKNILQPVLGERFVEAICTLPQIKSRVIDLYLAEIRTKSLPPVLVHTRSGAASGKTKFGSIAEASKHLLSRL